MKHESLSHANFDREEVERNYTLLEAALDNEDFNMAMRAIRRVLIALPDGEEREEFRAWAMELIKCAAPPEVHKRLFDALDAVGTTADWDAENDRHLAIIGDDDRPLHERLEALNWMEDQCSGHRNLRLIQLLREHILGGHAMDEPNAEFSALVAEIEQYGVGNHLDYTSKDLEAETHDE